MIAHHSNVFFDQFLQDEVFARFTAAAKQTIASAHNYVTPVHACDEANHQHSVDIDIHHLLLGLMSDRTDLVAQVLRSRGVTLPKVQHEVAQLLFNPKRRNVYEYFELCQ